MSSMCVGWEVVCPDGRVRNYPYHNRGDAECDAEEFTERQCQLFAEPSPIELNQPPCPEGKHTVRSIVMVHAEESAGQA